jgi:uncharacterized phage protein (TIGR01671 family)
MSREIKFRVWDSESKNWYDFEDGFLDYKEMKNGQYIAYSDLIEELVLMQYTGLKDKNGKEIYEGDIVRAVYEEDEGGGWHCDHKVRGKVYFDTHWGVKFDCRDATQRVAEHWERIPHTDFRNVEVIGNVYENSDLLQ